MKFNLLLIRSENTKNVIEIKEVFREHISNTTREIGISEHRIFYGNQ